MGNGDSLHVCCRRLEDKEAAHPDVDQISKHRLDGPARVVQNELTVFARHPHLFRWLPPQAGSVAFPQWTGPGTVEQFCQSLVERQGVMLVPGSLFDYPAPHFRLGLGRRSFVQALERVEAVSDQLSAVS